MLEKRQGVLLFFLPFAVHKRSKFELFCIVNVNSFLFFDLKPIFRQRICVAHEILMIIWPMKTVGMASNVGLCSTIGKSKVKKITAKWS